MRPPKPLEACNIKKKLVPVGNARTQTTDEDRPHYVLIQTKRAWVMKATSGYRDISMITVGIIHDQDSGEKIR